MMRGLTSFCLFCCFQSTVKELKRIAKFWSRQKRGMGMRARARVRSTRFAFAGFSCSRCLLVFAQVGESDEFASPSRTQWQQERSAQPEAIRSTQQPSLMFENQPVLDSSSQVGLAL